MRDEERMNWIDSFRDPVLAGNLAAHLKNMHPEPAVFMEVCGTHTMAIAKYSIRALMPPGITLISGPGCPVCVTSTADIDRFIEASRLPNTIITTFGDLIRVPGSNSSLKNEITHRADVRIVYSPLDAVEIARQNPQREVLFLGVGFETTAPTVAAAVMQAGHDGINNFSVLSSHKVIPPALEALAADPEIKLNGLICPGHVSVIIGADAYEPLADRYGIPCVITGFEPVDILQGIIGLLEQRAAGKPCVDIAYDRAVTRKGNKRAREIMHAVFKPEDAVWRGLGLIPDSGLAIRQKYQDFDAGNRFDLAVRKTQEPAGCKCGNVLKGIITPSKCKLFGKACNPEHPVGPCMVSSEGACAASFRYHR